MARGGQSIPFEQGDRGNVFESKDGAKWSWDTLVTSSSLMGILGLPDRALAVGEGGVILSSKSAADSN